MTATTINRQVKEKSLPMLGSEVDKCNFISTSRALPLKRRRRKHIALGHEVSIEIVLSDCHENVCSHDS